MCQAGSFVRNYLHYRTYFHIVYIKCLKINYSLQRDNNLKKFRKIIKLFHTKSLCLSFIIQFIMRHKLFTHSLHFLGELTASNFRQTRTDYICPILYTCKSIFGTQCEVRKFVGIVHWERTGPAADPALSFMASSRILSKNVKSGLSKTFITKDEEYRLQDHQSPMMPQVPIKWDNIIAYLKRPEIKVVWMLKNK